MQYKKNQKKMGNCIKRIISVCQALWQKLYILLSRLSQDNRVSWLHFPYLTDKGIEKLKKTTQEHICSKQWNQDHRSAYISIYRQPTRDLTNRKGLVIGPSHYVRSLSIKELPAR